jgi:hypothetical protein
MASTAYWNNNSLIPFAIQYYDEMNGECYHLVNAIQYGQAQSDSIIWRLLKLLN